ncbi:MAG: ATP-binding protein [Leptolyngbyaceae cyanobacterium MO_188.B28]|nr:ATP-binding protein [Leptolyngbyaceae cyanobacterium MO_188.B28]
MQEPAQKGFLEKVPQVVYPLRQRLLKTFLPITLVPLTILGGLGAVFIYRLTTQQANIKLYERSIFAAELTHRELEEALSSLKTTAINPLIQSAARSATERVEAENLHHQPIDQVEAQFAATKVLQTDDSLTEYLQQIAEVGGFAELFMTEKYGFNVAYSQITSDFVQRDEDWWRTGNAQGLWIGEPEYDESSQTVTVDIIYAIEDPSTQEVLGILKGGYDAKNLNILANGLENLLLEKSERLQIIKSGSEPQVILTVTAQGAIANHDLLVDPTVLQAALSDLGANANQSEASTTLSSSVKYDNQQYNFAQVPQTDWLIITSANLDEIYALESQWLLLFGGALLFLGAISWMIASQFARQRTAPLSKLTEVTQQVIQQADFTLKMPVKTQDEVGVLAASLNQLLEWTDNHTQELSQARQSLEERTEKLSLTLKELRQIQLQLVQNEKMSALGQLVAGIAHEINNPVNFIHGNLKHVQEYAQELLDFLQLYQTHYPQPVPEIQAEAEDIELAFLQQDLIDMIQSMKVGTDRIRQIVLSLRNFSRMDEAEFKTVDIHEGIEGTLMILQHRLKGKSHRPAIEVIQEYGDLPMVECYPGQLNQVLMNLLANGIDALELANKNRTFQEIRENPNQIIIRTSAIDSEWVQIAISDNGPGIPADIQKNIFDPFFTTKEVGKGTGMGLSISYKIIVEKHGGKLCCLSSQGQGAEFVIQIPVCQPKQEFLYAKKKLTVSALPAKLVAY